MILSVLCIYHHYGFTWYHWFWSILSLKKVDLTVFRLNPTVLFMVLLGARGLCCRL